MIPAPAAAGKVKLSLHGAWRGRAGPGLAGNDDSGWGGSARGGGKGCLRGEVRCLAGRGAGGCGTGAGGRRAGREAGVCPRALPCSGLVAGKDSDPVGRSFSAGESEVLNCSQPSERSNGPYRSGFSGLPSPLSLLAFPFSVTWEESRLHPE